MKEREQCARLFGDEWGLEVFHARICAIELRDEFAMANEKVAREPGHAEMPVTFVDAVGARAHVRDVCVGTRTAVEPSEDLGNGIADDVRFVVLYRETRLRFGEMAQRMAIGHRLPQRFAKCQIGCVGRALGKLRDINIRRMPRPHARRPPIRQHARHPIERRNEDRP